MKWLDFECLQHPHNRKLCGKRSISPQEIAMKKKFFFKNMKIDIFFTFFETSKSGFSWFWCCFWLISIGNPIENDPSVGRNHRKLKSWNFQTVFRTPKTAPLVVSVSLACKTHREPTFCLAEYSKSDLPCCCGAISTRISAKWAKIDQNHQNVGFPLDFHWILAQNMYFEIFKPFSARQRPPRWSYRCL